MDLATPQLSYDIGEPIVVENLFSYGDPNGLDDIDRISVRLTSGDGYLYLEGGNSPESTTVSVRTDELSTLRFVARSSLPNVVLEIEVQDQAAEIERETLRLDFNELDGWDALIAAISFPQTSFGFFGNREMTDLEQRLVLVQLQKLYELSPIARTTLDNFVNNGGTFEIYGSNDATAEFKSNLTGSFGAVILNLNYALSKEYVNVEGGFSVYGIGQIIFHEMLHAIDWAEGNPDPIIEDENLKLSDIPFDQPDFDHLGHVIRTVNTVREEIGDVPLRGSYKPTPTGDVKAYIEYLKQYIPWTFDQAIIFFRDLSNDDPEAANPQLFRSDGSDFTRDLVYGLNRRNEIIVGSASDMVFGAGGDDMIDLGDGEDRGMGLGGNDIIKGGNGFDQAIYQNSITAYTIYVNGFGEIVVNHDGAGQVDKNDGTDRLTQVEEAVFSDATLDLASFRKAVLAPSETASFRYTVEEFDGLDVSESNGGDTLEFVNVNFDERSLTVTYGFAIR